MSPDIVILFLLVCAQGVQVYLTNKTLRQHKEILRFFAEHIKVDRKNIPEAMPEDLKRLMDDEGGDDKE